MARIRMSMGTAPMPRTAITITITPRAAICRWR